MNGHPNTGNYLLDSCTLLWLAGDQAKLSRNAKEAMLNASKVYISPISGWELATKARKGILKFPCSLHDWWEQAKKDHGLIEVFFNGKTAIRSAELPLLHSDPADRLLIATAEAEGLVIITPDHQIQRYASVKTLW